MIKSFPPSNGGSFLDGFKFTKHGAEVRERAELCGLGERRGLHVIELQVDLHPAIARWTAETCAGWQDESCSGPSFMLAVSTSCVCGLKNSALQMYSPFGELILLY